MPDPGETSAFSGLGLPVVTAGARLEPLPARPLFSITPFPGRAEAVAAALGATALPVGRVAELPAGRLIWAGLDQWFLQGTPPDPLPGAALTDQSDGWSGLRLAGTDAARALNRLVPLDLHRDAFPPGHAARSLLGHMMALVIATPDGYELFVMRSFTATAVHELDRALRSVAAIASLRATARQVGGCAGGEKV